MKVSTITAMAIGVCLTSLLSACTSPTPSPPPTPTVMTKSEAADLYLSTVCPNNAAGDVLFQALNADPGDFEAIKAAADAYASTQTNSAEVFDDPTILWPENIRKDIPVMSEDAFSVLSWIAQIEAATTLEETYIYPPAIGDAQTSSQRIRSRLGISSDIVESCADYQ